MAESRIRIGVLLRRRRDKREPFGASTALWKKLAEVGRDLSTEVVAIAASDMEDYEWEDGGLPAWHWDPGSGPQRRRTPLPHVVYDRLKGPDGESARRVIRSLQIPLFNSNPLDKWQSLRALRQDLRLRHLLPATELLRAPAQVVQMTRMFDQVYLKPVYGSLGRGILRVQRSGSGFLCQHTRPGRKEVRTALYDEARLRRWLERWTGGDHFLVQQGLNLRVVRGRTTDIRVLTQKDGRGRWLLTGMAARVGASGRYTSNLATGGRGVPVQHLLAAVFPGEPDHQNAIHRHIVQVALLICQALDDETENLAELGIDLGLDAAGRLWYIEHNYYPFRNVFRDIRDLDTFRLSHQRPLEYAQYLVRRETEVAFASLRGRKQRPDRAADGAERLAPQPPPMREPEVIRVVPARRVDLPTRSDPTPVLVPAGMVAQEWPPTPARPDPSPGSPRRYHWRWASGSTRPLR